MSEYIHPPCCGCGGPVVRYEDDRESKYRDRLYCSRSCANRNRRPAYIHPPCRNPACGAPVVRHQNENLGNYRARLHCSRSCAASARELAKTPGAGHYVHPPCPECGRAVVKRHDERTNSYRERQCCSRLCDQNRRRRALFERIAAHSHPPCANPACGGPVLYIEGEGFARWVVRKTCCPACLGEMMAAQGQPLDSLVPRGPLVPLDFGGAKPFAAHDLGDPGDIYGRRPPTRAGTYVPAVSTIGGW